MFKKDCVTCEYRMRADQQDPCNNCMEHELDRSRITQYKNWQPSKLYTAYLAAEARANRAEVNLLLARDKVTGGCIGEMDANDF